MSTNPLNPDPISNLTNRLSNQFRRFITESRNPGNAETKKGELVTFKFDKVAYTVEIVGTGKATDQYKNHFNVEYK